MEPSAPPFEGYRPLSSDADEMKLAAAVVAGPAPPQTAVNLYPAVPKLASSAAAGNGGAAAGSKAQIVLS